MFLPEVDRVLVSCTFTADMIEARRLERAWEAHYPGKVTLGGPAMDDEGGAFIPGMFLHQGYVITSRGCPNACGFCFVPRREGRIRELPVMPGHDILDNNLLACADRHVEEVLQMLAAQRQRARFSGGLEAQRVTDALVERLRSVRVEELFLAYDTEGAWATTGTAIRRLRSAGLGRDAVRCYVLAGFTPNDTPTAAAARCEQVLVAGGLPFLMLYQPEGLQRRYSPEWLAVRRKYVRPAEMLPAGRRAALSALAIGGS